MYQFFVPREQIDETSHVVLIRGEDVNHIQNVLRMRPGEEFIVRAQGDEQGDEYRCAVAEYGAEEVRCELRFVKHSRSELPGKVTLYQCLPKGDKMETVIQKCTELGACRFVPVASKRCVVRLEPKKAQAKQARWQAIAEAAAKQSKRAIIPEVGAVMSFAEAAKEAARADLALIPYELESGMEGTRALLSEHAKTAGTVSILIGPEGGFDETEVSLAKDLGIRPVTLGPRILRTETAGMVVLAWLGFLTDADET